MGYLFKFGIIFMFKCLKFMAGYFCCSITMLINLNGYHLRQKRLNYTVTKVCSLFFTNFVWLCGDKN